MAETTGTKRCHHCSSEIAKAEGKSGQYVGRDGLCWHVECRDELLKLDGLSVQFSDDIMCPICINPILGPSWKRPAGIYDGVQHYGGYHPWCWIEHQVSVAPRDKSPVTPEGPSHPVGTPWKEPKCLICSDLIQRGQRFVSLRKNWYHEICLDRCESSQIFLCQCCGELIGPFDKKTWDECLSHRGWCHDDCLEKLRGKSAEHEGPTTVLLCGYCGESIGTREGTVSDLDLGRVHEACYRKINDERQAKHEAEQLAATSDKVETHGSWLKVLSYATMACHRCREPIVNGTEYVQAPSERASRHVYLHRGCIPGDVITCGQCDLPIVDGPELVVESGGRRFHKWCAQWGVGAWESALHVTTAVHGLECQGCSQAIPVGTRFAVIPGPGGVRFWFRHLSCLENPLTLCAICGDPIPPHVIAAGCTLGNAEGHLEHVWCRSFADAMARRNDRPIESHIVCAQCGRKIYRGQSYSVVAQGGTKAIGLHRECQGAYEKSLAEIASKKATARKPKTAEQAPKTRGTKPKPKGRKR